MAFDKVRKREIRGVTRFTVEWRDGYGARKQKKFRTEAEATRFIEAGQATRQSGLRPELPSSATSTMRSWAEYWLSEIVPVTRAPKTARSYHDMLHRFILPRQASNPHGIGALKPVEVNPTHLAHILAWWKRQGYAADSLRLMWANTSACLSDAVDYQLLSFNPLQTKPKSIRRLIEPEDDSDVRRAMTQEQANQFLFAAKVSPLYAQFLTGLDSGLRIGEWRALQIPDVSLQESTLTIVRKLSETGRREGPTKGKRRRVVALTNRLRTLLQKTIQERPALALERGWRPVPSWLFVTRNGTPYGQRNVQTEFDRVLANAGLGAQGFSPHSLRHTFACLHLANAKNVNIIQWVQQQLGHASILTTMEYSKTIRIFDPDAADRLELLVHGAVGAGHATIGATIGD